MSQRYEVIYDRDQRQLRIVPRTPLTVQMRDLLERASTLFGMLPGIPVIGELVKQALAMRMSEDDLSRLIEVLYGTDATSFYALQGAAPHKRLTSLTIRQYWRTFQWNAKADLQLLTSVREIEIAAWVGARTREGAGTVVLASPNEVPLPLILTSGLVAILEFEALLRLCERELGISFFAPRAQQECLLRFVTQGGDRSIPFFETHYQRCALPGVDFAEFLRLRAGHANLAA